MFHFRAGQMHYALREYEASFPYFESAYELYPLNTNHILFYTNVLERRKELNRADSVINAALKIDSTNVSIIERRINLSFGRDRWQEVIVWGNKLLADSIDAPSSYLKHAYSYLSNGNGDSTIIICDYLQANNFMSEEVFYNKALALASKRRFSESNQQLDNSIKLTIQRSTLKYLEAKATNYRSMQDVNNEVAIFDTAYYYF